MNEEERREMESLKQENERFKRWFELMENAPGEAKEIIRERALSAHYLQPILESWKRRVNELQMELNKLKSGEKEE